jgi:hypothetical protein
MSVMKTNRNEPEFSPWIDPGAAKAARITANRIIVMILVNLRDICRLLPVYVRGSLYISRRNTGRAIDLWSIGKACLWMKYPGTAPEDRPLTPPTGAAGYFME